MTVVEIEELDANTFRDIPEEEKKSELIAEIEDDILTIKWIIIAIAAIVTVKIVQYLMGW